MIFGLLQSVNNGLRISRLLQIHVTERDGNIAQPAGITRAAYRAAFGSLQKFFLRPVEKPNQ